MILSDIETMVGDLCNDPDHTRYTTSQIDTVLNNVIDEWNLEAGILKDTVTLTVTAGQSTYAISGLAGTPVRFDRVTHKGIELSRRDKAWFDLYASDDWSDDIGTPTQYYINVSDPDLQNIYLYPIPQDADAGAYLIVEYVRRPTPLSSSSDIPFNSNALLYSYHHGLAYRTAGYLLLRDPSNENNVKAGAYLKTGNNILTKVVEVFKNQERENPLRLRGGRNW